MDISIVSSVMKSFCPPYLTFGILFFLSSMLAAQPTSEEGLCNNGIDDDGDGYIDCYDGDCQGDDNCDDFYFGNSVFCQEDPTANPAFAMRLQWASDNQTADSYATPIVGDLDGNGIPEVVSVNWLQEKIYILSGADGSVQYTINMPFDPLYQVAIGNVDNSECAWIFVTELDQGSLANSEKVAAYDCEGNQQWIVDATKLYGPGIPNLADFNQDGVPELYYKNEIRDARTGNLLVAGVGGTYDWYYTEAFGTLAIDILPDSDCANCEGLELVTGEYIYSVDIASGSLNVERDIDNILSAMGESNYEFRSYRTAISAADYNLDGNVDILMPGDIDRNGNDFTTVVFWDVANNTVDFYQDPGNNWSWGTGRINLADVDGDDLMNAIYVSGQSLYALDENMDLLWKVGIKETSSGFTGCTLFDFNGDGAAETIYRSEESLLVINGDGTVNTAQSEACVSRTAEEYPIVADVDGDGASEICLTCLTDDNMSIDGSNWPNTQYSQVRVYEADNNEVWQPARKVWNQHAYFNVNINDDLTIPSVQQDHTRIFGSIDCFTGQPLDNRPLNGFLNQSTYIDETGCPSYVSPDVNFCGKYCGR